MPSLLESFYIMFTSNADQLKKGEDDAKRSTNDLETSLTATDRAGVQMGQALVTSLGEVGAAFAAAFSVERIAAAVTNEAAFNAQLGLTATRLNIGVEQLAAWSEASSRFNGGDRNGFVQTLDYLNRGLADIATKGTSRLKPFFDELKIRVTDGPKQVRPLLDVLGDLSDRFVKLGAQQRAGIAEKLGIDTGTLLLLGQGRRAIDDMLTRQKELGTVTEHDTEVAHKYAMSLADLEQRGRSFATAFGSAVLPVITSFLQWVGKAVDYLSSHKGLIEGFFVGISAVILTVYGPAIAQAAIWTLATVGPYLLAAAAIAAVGVALGLAYDDIQHYLAGQRSVLGELEKRWPQVAQTVRDAIHQIGENIAWLKDVWSAFSDLAGADSRLLGFAWTQLEALAARVFPVIGAVVAWLVKQFNNAFPLIGLELKAAGAIFEWLGGVAGDIFKAIGKGVDWLVDRFKHLADMIRSVAGVVNAVGDYVGAPALAPAHATAGAAAPRQATTAPPVRLAQARAEDYVRIAQAAIVAADRTPLSAFSGHTLAAAGGGPSNRTINLAITGPITIDASGGDPNDIARGFSDRIQAELRQALDHFDDGVRS